MLKFLKMYSAKKVSVFCFLTMKVNSKKCEKCVSFTKDATEIRQPYKHRITIVPRGLFMTALQ
jgi:hypothetical protein